MVKKKSNQSLFSTLIQQIHSQPSSSSSGEYHLIDNEYFAAFNTLDDIQKFHNKLIENQSNNNEEDEDQNDHDIDMKTFAQQYLIDLPEPITTTNEIVSINSKRQRRNIRDLPQSNNFVFMSDDDHGNIFDSLKEKKSSSSSSSSRLKRIAYEDMSSILLTLDVKQKRKKHSEPTIAIELAEPSIIKNEPIEQEQLVITHVIEAKDEPVEINVIPTGPMGFGTPEYSGDLDNYVQNIHRSCSTNVSIVNPPLSSSTLLSRPKRIRKRKRLYIEESESMIQPKRIRKKRTTTSIQLNPTLLTDAEIEKQFGERLSPTIKSETTDDVQQIVIETETIPQTPIEKARAKLTNALERGHGPDTFLLKIRSRESKMIEIELAIYGTADWYSSRVKILSKIEEALRSLRVSWTKIDIRVDDFDVQICTSPQAASLTPPTSLTNTNSSWFLKALSESGPLIVHIHDRKYPQQRTFIKCSCPQCCLSNHNQPSLPIIINTSPIKSSSSSNRRLLPPTILRKSSPIISSSLYNIHTKFFQELISQYGTNIISTVTQCVLDLTLITSIHSSLGNILESNENYEKEYQQIIDPLKYNTDNQIISKSLNEPDILTFYRIIKQHKANIRNAQSMKNIIFSNLNKTTMLNRRSISKRYRNHISTNERMKAHFTPIIELKPILGGSTTNNEESIRKITKIISTNTIQKDAQRINTITTQEITPRVIRLLTSNSIRLVTATTPLVPKQINIIKPLSTSSSLITPAIKLSNPILISNKFQQPSIK